MADLKMNRSTEYSPYKELILMMKSRSRTEYALETTMYFVITLMAVLGNVLVCFIFYKHPRLRSPTYLYILALAISDIAMATFCMPLVWGVLLVGEWKYSNTVCGMHGFAVLFLAFVSIHTITLLAFNRYCRVMKPWLFRRIFNKTFVGLSMMGVVLTAGLLLGLPLVVGWGFFGLHAGKITCILEFHNPITDKIYTTMLGVVIVLIPFGVIIYCYAKVFLKVQRHRRRFSSTCQADADTRGSKLSVEEVNITKTLFAIVLGFTICWLPIFSIEFTDSLTGNRSLPRKVYLVSVFLVSISAVINPVIYGVLNKTFRSKYCSIYYSCCATSVVKVLRKESRHAKHIGSGV